MHVMGKLLELMMEVVFAVKYSNMDSPIVNVEINHIVIPDTFLDLGSTIIVIP